MEKKEEKAVGELTGEALESFLIDYLKVALFVHSFLVVLIYWAAIRGVGGGAAECTRGVSVARARRARASRLQARRPRRDWRPCRHAR